MELNLDLKFNAIRGVQSSLPANSASASGTSASGTSAFLFRRFYPAVSYRVGFPYETASTSVWKGGRRLIKVD